jgi:hypothetical protein
VIFGHRRANGSGTDLRLPLGDMFTPQLLRLLLGRLANRSPYRPRIKGSQPQQD